MPVRAEAHSRGGSRSIVTAMSFDEWFDSNMSFPRTSSELKLWSERRGDNIEQDWDRSDVEEVMGVETGILPFNRRWSVGSQQIQSDVRRQSPFHTNRS